VTIEGFSGGVYRFAAGLAKKFVLADALAELVPVVMNGSPSDLSVLGAWLRAILFGLQIYFDFSGYSDMAIGLAAMFGFTLRENFDYPYVSRSAAEFWPRWNMSVGRFLRDNVYIPLGGGRKRALPNLLLVWLLTGLWHGASWNFVVWGMYFGVLIALERTLLNRLLDALPRLVSHIYFTGAVLVGWVIIYFESLPRGLAHVRAMFGFAPAGHASPAADGRLESAMRHAGTSTGSFSAGPALGDNHGIRTWAAPHRRHQGFGRQCVHPIPAAALQGDLCDRPAPVPSAARRFRAQARHPRTARPQQCGSCFAYRLYPAAGIALLKLGTDREQRQPGGFLWKTGLGVCIACRRFLERHGEVLGNPRRFRSRQA